MLLLMGSVPEWQEKNQSFFYYVTEKCPFVFVTANTVIFAKEG